jgi:ElaB/YqjD/DUF883 family membrane-anchored ribosome-binding protein
MEQGFHDGRFMFQSLNTKKEHRRPMSSYTSSTTKNGTSAATEATKAEAAVDYNALKADLAALKNDIKSLMSDAGRYAKVQTHRGADAAREGAEHAGDAVDEYRSSFEAKVRENPLAAVGIALGAGLVLGMLRRK